MQEAIVHSPSTETRVNRLLGTLLRRVLTVWLVGFVIVMMVIGFVDRGLAVSAFAISIASGFVALAAIWPVAWFVRRPSFSQSAIGGESLVSANSGDLVSAFTAGIALRLFGTVVLFLLCRYQMGQQPEAIAALVGGWYALLTSVEVFSIAKFNAEIHRSTGDQRVSSTADLAITAKIGLQHSTPAHTSLTE